MQSRIFSFRKHIAHSFSYTFTNLKHPEEYQLSYIIEITGGRINRSQASRGIVTVALPPGVRICRVNAQSRSQTIVVPETHSVIRPQSPFAQKLANLVVSISRRSYAVNHVGQAVAATLPPK
jgi:hypothetical protein